MGEFLFSLCTIYFFGGGFRGNGRAWSRPSCRPAMASSRRSTSEMRCSGLSCQPKTASAEQREEETASSSSCDGTVISKLFEFMHENFHIHIHHAVRLLESISSSKESAQKNARFRGTSRTRTSISSPVIINASRVVGGF